MGVKMKKIKRNKVSKNIPDHLDKIATMILEGSYSELKSNINGKFYSGCCI